VTLSRIADGDRIAALRAEARGEPRIGPRFTALRDAGGALAALAACRTSTIAPAADNRCDRLDVGQNRTRPRRVRAGALHHAVELQRRLFTQARALPPRSRSVRRGSIARDQHVRAEQQIRLLRERAFDAVGEKSDGTDARDGEHQAATSTVSSPARQSRESIRSASAACHC
jgi:hypothetical protein